MTLAEWLKASEEGITVEGENSDNNDNVHVYTVTFGGEGVDADYRVTTSMTDYAGNDNESVAYAESIETTKESFTVDMVKPNMSVQYFILEDDGTNTSPNATTYEIHRFYTNPPVDAVVTIP